MPRFGLGTWLSEKGKVGAAVKEALRIGYRHVDCAHIYGNEAEIGEALTESFAAGHAKREEVFVTSKLWNADHAAGDVRKACELTLKNLQLEYLDLYLIHWPIRCRPNAPPPGQMSYDDKLGYSSEMIMETWREMEKLVDAGLVRAIGVSNFTIPKLKALVEKAKLVPAVNQVESHPYFQQPKLKEFCAEKGIVFEAYSPLGAAGRPPRAQEAGAPVVLEDPVLISIAKKHDRSPAQVALSWALAHGHVVIPKSRYTVEDRREPRRH